MDPKTIRTRLQELAFLNSSATIWFRATPASIPSSSSNGSISSLNGASTPESSSSSNGVGPRGAEASAGPSSKEEQEGWERLHFSGGLREYVAFLNKDMQPMHEPLFITDMVRAYMHAAWYLIPALRKASSPNNQCVFMHVLVGHAQADGVVVEVALQWCSDSFSDLLVGFVNSVKTIDGGTHIDGLKVRMLRGPCIAILALQWLVYSCCSIMEKVSCMQGSTSPACLSHMTRWMMQGVEPCTQSE